LAAAPAGPRARWRRRRSLEPWSDLRPIRAELFGPERFEAHAVSLADAQTIVARARPVVSILQRVDEDAGALASAYEAVVDELEAGRTITPAAEWLLDNFHMVERHVRQIRQDLPAGYFRQLPKLGPGFLEGHPRIFGIVWAYVAHTDSFFDPELLARYVRAYESRRALTLGELWAVAITLRLVLIENLRRIAHLVEVSIEDRNLADAIADGSLGLAGADRRAIGELLPEHEAFDPSDSFTVQLVRRLTGEPFAEDTLVWLNRRLAARGSNADIALHAEHQSLAAHTVTVRNIFTSLRLLNDTNWEDWLESVSLIEDELRSNRGYAALDFKTRNLYRSQIETLSRRAGQEEISVTRTALWHARVGADERERDVGHWLIGDGRAQFAHQLGYRPTVRERMQSLIKSGGIGGYLLVLTLVTATLLVAAIWATWAVAADQAGWTEAIVLAALALLPLSDLALGLINHRSAVFFHATPLPSLALRSGVPPALRTLVAIPAMLTSIDNVDELADQIEVHYLANQDGETYFALVTDWADAAEQSRAGDELLLSLARERVRALNERYGDRFLLLHRERRLNPAEGVWMGWERKRGKLTELGRWLRGASDTSFIAVEGRLPGRVRYVVTVDSDTVLPRESVRRLVGTISHPLNLARYDPDEGRVTGGYGILQPRVTPSLPKGDGSSLIQRVYSTPRGLDPYAFAVSDVYQDLFDEGSFAGKGIYDLDVVERVLDGRVPDNTLLSHDLLEGNYARSGLVTDVEVVEEYPMSYEVVASRQHRWTRGDWQLLPWILHRREGLSALGLWKMTDNLRRSLSPVALAVALPVGLALLPLASAIVWAAILVGTFFLPPLLPLLPRLLRLRPELTIRSQLAALAEDVRQTLLLGLGNLTFLAHQAALNTDAIVRTLVRMAVTKRHLLEWTTAAAAQRRAKDSLRSYLALMWPGLILPVAALTIALLRGQAFVIIAAGPILLWFAAPLIAQHASRPYGATELAASAEDLSALRVVARRTWLFFEAFVSKRENDLPPDNFQEDPEPVIAARTSPTNIGLYLLAVVSAHELGWCGMHEAADRLEATLATVERLESHRGHLLNWYDTRTLTPLEPRYISTVDSGNLAGHLITVANACRGWLENPDRPLRPALGLRDAVRLVRQTLSDGEHDGAAREQLREVAGLCEILDQELTMLGTVPTLAGHLEELTAHTTRLIEATRQTVVSGGDPELVVWSYALQRSLLSQRRDLTADEDEVRLVSQRLAAIERRCRELFDAMDFTFLYDRRRSLLSVGYQVGSGTLDESSYDLLASEARLASYVAIIKGDVRTRHWFLLGRTVTPVAGSAALQSWSGSMFEYLMPALVIRTPATSLLTETRELIVRRQIEYAERLGVPWGISESAYNARDYHLTYQYSPFGVPGLGVARGLANNVVVAPYATGLAAMVEPGEARRNYERLARLGARGRYGYYESIDFTASRVPRDEGHAIVRCFMAHHQGMTIVAIHNAVTDGGIRERFHAEPMVRSGEMLLEERAPRYVPRRQALREEHDAARAVRTLTPPVERTFTGDAALQPHVMLLSNGRLSQTLTSAGGGSLRWRGNAITRWHPDPTTETPGDIIYLRDDASGRVWTTTVQPAIGPRTRPDVRFTEERATFSRVRGPIRTEVVHHLSPEDDAIVRRLTIENRSRRSRRLTLATYAELVLGRAADDDAHPAFSKMFVQTEYLPEASALIATRRRRSSSDDHVWAGQMILVEEGALGSPTPETDRRHFIGRDGSLSDPAMLRRGGRPTGRSGYSLDPIFSLTQRIRVPARDRIHVQIWTFAASSREEIVELIDRHRAERSFSRVAMLGWTQSQVELRHLGISSDEARMFQVLAGHVLYPRPELRPPADVLARCAGPQSRLWPLAISGDLPIVVVRAEEDDDVDLVRQLVRAFEYWRLKRFAVDLVILNDRSSTYVQDFGRTLEASAAAIRPRTSAPDSSGRIFVLQSDQLGPESLDALIGSARVVLVAQRGDLAQQLERVPAHDADAASDTARRALTAAVRVLPRTTPQPQPAPPRPQGLLHDNGTGGFSADGREYVTVIDPGAPTPAPWTNVIANGQFGFHATAEGAGYTWWRNSRDNQLTPWRNDPVLAPLSEAVYVRDALSGELLSPCASPRGSGRHVARHGFGYTTYEHETPVLALSMTQFVPDDDAVKLSVLRIENRSDEERPLTVTAYAEVLLGMQRHLNAGHLITEHDQETGALLVRNPWSTQFADQVVFLDMDGEQDSVTGDRLEFLGLQGELGDPAALRSDAPLSGWTGVGRDPCAAIQRELVLAPGAEIRVVIAFGAATDRDGAAELVHRYRELDPDAVLAAVRERWLERLTTVQVRTPDSAFDLMMNGWLLYQTLACRMLARSGYYQASGAYGFRDQLQDSMATVLIDPPLARGHVLRAAGRQFLEGDVQHWWLPASGQGVRTRISDDVVWLANAVSRYVRVTGDVAILDEQVPFLEGRSLEDGEHESFSAPETSSITASLYDHCVLGLRRAFATGVHGLPLIGTGDWNDGMNRVGEKGRGESVWLGWFLHTTLTEFAALARSRGDDDFAQACLEHQERLLAALELHGWDGGWYRRGYFDDGTPLGSVTRPECRIDAIAQSWAVLSGAARPARAAAVMEQVDRQLILHDAKVARLFTPPFDRSEPDPGYIGAYPPGVRENGGQYTHGALWSIFAYAKLGRRDRAARLFALINPVNHAATAAAAATYRVEPYVLAADVYSVPPYVGRGGWTWYTGSSAWMFRAGLEAILGVRREGDALVFDPCLPPDWQHAEVRYRHEDTTYVIGFESPDDSGSQPVAIVLDGERLEHPDRLPLVADGREHTVTVVLGAPDHMP